MQVTNIEEHPFAIVKFELPDEDGIIKAIGKCQDCHQPMVRAYDLTNDNIEYFIEE